MNKTTLLCLFLLAFALPAAAQTFDSGTNRVPLLELYTSEGCSSCPPADRWLSRLANDPALWSDVVPVALHVDYWDYLGWDDRFSRPENAKRQRLYRRQGYVSGVYTPGVMLAGREWRDWRRGAAPQLGEPKQVGPLRLEVTGNRLSASFDATEPGRLRDPILHVAVLGFGLESEVGAGENRGRRLAHDFVVLGHSTLRSGDTRWEGALPDALDNHGAARLAIAAWVSDGVDLNPIQAVGGWLPDAD